MSRLRNRLICSIRSASYGIYEPVRVRLARRCNRRIGEPVVTVIIPTFNRADLLLERALHSVLQQTYENIEVLVAAHGCTDDTHERVANLGDSRIRLLRVPRRPAYPPTIENHWFAGPVAPINAALRVVSGDWIARIDDDDIWTRDHLERLLDFALSGNYEFVSSGYLRERDCIRETVPHDSGNPPIGGVQTWLYRSYLRFMKANPDCWRKSWDRVNDTDLAARFRDAGVKIGWLNAVTAYILPRPGETTVGLAAYKRYELKEKRRLSFHPQQHDKQGA